MTHEEAIKWLKMQSRKPVKWNDYSEENRVIREEAERRLKEAYNMAIDALKAQGPRVMTLEEVKELHPEDDVYIERISSITGVHYIYATTVWRVVSKSIMFCPDNATLWFSEYGETWRCWTGRPTDAQMEATKWIS